MKFDQLDQDANNKQNESHFAFVKGTAIGTTLSYKSDFIHTLRGK